MLHNICHRNPWQKKYRNTMKWIIEFMGLFYGLPPRLYYYHHIKMHHREGNGPHDLSSTEKYQRDSFLHWLHYFLTFVFLGPILLPSYFYRRNKKDFALKVLIGYLFFYTFLITVSLLNAKGALIVFVLPTLLCWFGLMSGNWTQHAFLDQENPDDSYLNSITVIDALYNQRCFNDGYHIGHHLYPGMHWSEMPSEFQNNLNEYHQKRTVIFKTLDYQTIWVFLMFKNYKKIAQYIVQDPNNKRDLEETITFLKSKLAPIKR
jgi:fatty acid desaturase